MTYVKGLSAQLKRTTTEKKDIFPNHLICFSHLRWDFVFQRPQHLLTRFAQKTKVYFIEEPVFVETDKPHYITTDKGNGVTVLVPQIAHGTQHHTVIAIQQQLLSELMAQLPQDDIAFWYYTPMALSFSSQFRPRLIIFDCMDELSAFKFAPQELKDQEAALMRRADIVFTGGHSLYHAKKGRHENLHAFPSSIDKAHFAQARTIPHDPSDQKNIPYPRLGFYGVIDERFDIDAIAGMAAARPDWHIVLIGPVVKIDPETLPKLPNIHYLGGKGYNELPEYLAGWDVALIPFAMNESTKYISPTKTPEYLAGGKPVISTPITDVVTPYGDLGLVKIAANAEEFVAAGDALLSPKFERAAWLEEVDAFLKNSSWDRTFEAMWNLCNKTIEEKKAIPVTTAASASKVA